jgi:hypothetical protein
MTDKNIQWRPIRTLKRVTWEGFFGFNSRKFYGYQNAVSQEQNRVSIEPDRIGDQSGNLIAIHRRNALDPPEFLILVPWKQLPNERIFKKYRKMRSQGGSSCSKSMASWNPYQPMPRESQPTECSNWHSVPLLRRNWLFMIRIFTAFRITRLTPLYPPSSTKCPSG